MPKCKLAAYAVSLLVVMNQLTGCSTPRTPVEITPASSTPPPFEPFIEIENTSFGFVGSLRRPSGKVLGSAVLIDSNVALTAAHCLIDTDLSFVEFAGKHYDIDYTMCYDEKSYDEHDIGLVFLSEDVSGVDPVGRIDDSGVTSPPLDTHGDSRRYHHSAHSDTMVCCTMKRTRSRCYHTLVVSGSVILVVDCFGLDLMDLN